MPLCRATCPLAAQEDGDERSLRLNFLAKLTPAALALRPGHVVVIAGAVDGNPARSADARVAGSKVHSASVWHEVCAKWSQGSQGYQLRTRFQSKSV